MNEKFEQECDGLAGEIVNKSTFDVSGGDSHGMNKTSELSEPKARLAGSPVSFMTSSG
jgi:hypothetical protein